jgi:tRNA/rRNA methyltransferase
MFTQEQKLASVRIVLVEPAGDRNVGAIARVMKNFGLQQLVLVNPQCDPQSEDSQYMAVHAKDVLAAATVVETLPEALQGCVRAIATTARDRLAPLEHPHTALPWLLETPMEQASALIFGPECRGLSNQELNYAQRFVRIPSNPNYSSLNLAQAVAVCCYELTQAVDFSFGDRSAPSMDYAAFEEVEGYYQHLQEVLLTIGYVYPHTAASRMDKFRQIFNRAQLDKNEVNMLRGILTQMQWALQKNAASPEEKR